jgi:hypothetical protein
LLAASCRLPVKKPKLLSPPTLNLPPSTQFPYQPPRRKRNQISTTEKFQQGMPGREGRNAPSATNHPASVNTNVSTDNGQLTTDNSSLPPIITGPFAKKVPDDTCPSPCKSRI